MCSIKSIETKKKQKKKKKRKKTNLMAPSHAYGATGPNFQSHYEKTV